MGQIFSYSSRTSSSFTLPHFMCFALMGACGEFFFLPGHSTNSPIYVLPDHQRSTISFLHDTTELKLASKLSSSFIVPRLLVGAPNPSPLLATMIKYLMSRLGYRIGIMALISPLICKRVGTKQPLLIGKANECHSLIGGLRISWTPRTHHRH